MVCWLVAIRVLSLCPRALWQGGMGAGKRMRCEGSAETLNPKP